MPSNRPFLLDHLARMPLLDGRYADIQCVNYDPTNKRQLHGKFSLVFKAQDTVHDRKVAIKFFDPDRTNPAQPYRLLAFQREPELLKTLLGKRRCLQLVETLKSISVNLSLPDAQQPITLSFSYFVLDWLEDGIDSFFESQQDYDALTKLELFRDVVLAVDALHHHQIHHRDLKPDNFRSYLDNLKRIVVAIDLGTAARYDTLSLLPDYDNPVGLPLYSAPETFCGLAGHRELSRYTDYFAMGCMLWELFSPNYFGEELRKTNAFDTVCFAICQLLMNAKDQESKAKVYRSEIGRFKRAIPFPAFDTFGVIVPLAIEPMLNRLLVGLSSIDFQDRFTSLSDALRLLDIAIRILKNQRIYDERAARRKLFRERRIARLQQKEERLARYLRQPTDRAIANDR